MLRLPRSTPPKYLLSNPQFLEKRFWVQPNTFREALMRRPSFNSSTFVTVIFLKSRLAVAADLLYKPCDRWKIPHASLRLSNIARFRDTSLVMGRGEPEFNLREKADYGG